jgi:hypothetical protein
MYYSCMFRNIFLYYYTFYIVEMPWIPPARWVVIAQYRVIPLPIRPIPPLPKKGSSTRAVLAMITKNKSGLKKEGECKADGSNDV